MDNLLFANGAPPGKVKFPRLYTRLSSVANDSGAREKMAQFGPESVVQFAPEWVAYFGAEWVAQFGPEYADKTTFFAAGLIRSRDGTIEKVVLTDIVGNHATEIIIIVRSVGTGGYLSAHAFSFDKKKLIFRDTVEELPPYSDPVVALRKAMKRLK